ncbi:protein FRA10AC1-like [Dendronephthya gigantea]|uniref:protein FRA10AC1-like n=1 Tax=Dendronephthya gigantea TaxID=151771 RepID=UPI001069125C|nr:protein FRA10AC1-like [Dendronephthya gigantea]
MATNRGAFEKEMSHGAAGGYTSEFSEVDENERKRTWRDDQLSGVHRRPNRTFGLPSKQTISQEYDREEAKNHRFHLLRLDAYSRHKVYINNYLKYYGGSMEDFRRDSSRDKTDYDVLREQHRFVWSEEDDNDSSWEKRLAKKYYDKLFKEYCISDLSRYKENKVALRWRVEKEVMSGKGQFICGNKTCDITADLQSWEVNFSYREHGEKKNTLVKLRLCPDCSVKLNYHHKRKAVKKKARKEKKHKKAKRRRKSDEGSDDSSSKKESEERPDEGKSSTSKDLEEGSDVWEKPVTAVVEKTREEEFDDYFDDMFL